MATSSNFPLNIGAAAPAGGGGGAGGGGISGLKAGSGFYLTGENASRGHQSAEQSTVANRLYWDYIYFDGNTTIDLVGNVNGNAPTGQTMTIALHPVTERGVIGAQAFSVQHSNGTVVGFSGTAVDWTPTEGWYVVVFWSDVAVIDIVHTNASGDSGNNGMYYSGYMQHFGREVEMKAHFLYKDDYDVSPDLSAIDFNDITNYGTSATTNGKISYTTTMPIVYMRVQ